MLQSWIAELKRSMSATITGYLLQALAVIPFLVALGFATAAIVIYLKAVLGDTPAYLVMAAGFALIGVVVLLFGRSVEEHPKLAESQGASTTPETNTASILDSNLAAVAGLVISHPGLAFRALKILLRNIPALIAGAALGGLLFSDARQRAAAEGDSPSPSV